MCLEQNSGAIGTDADPKTHADVIRDLGTILLSVSDNDFDDIVCRHVADHVPDVMSFIAREKIAIRFFGN
jgi:2-polyprenyl-3-methyl-5-hydroxy-6-metoxy-1,4-benzoquinol methylase